MISAFPNPPAISPLSSESISCEISVTGLGFASFVTAFNPVTSTAYFIPFCLAQPASVTQLFCANGTTAQGSIDVGIYDEDGEYIISAGSTTQSGTSAIQAFTLSPNVIIGPGRFYLAISLANTQGHYLRMVWTTTTLGTLAGMKYVFDTFPLPTTAVTFTNLTTTSAALPFRALATVPLIGLSPNVTI